MEGMANSLDDLKEEETNVDIGEFDSLLDFEAAEEVSVLCFVLIYVFINRYRELKLQKRNLRHLKIHSQNQFQNQ